MRIPILIFLCFSLTACEGTEHEKAQAGAIIGALAGAIIAASSTDNSQNRDRNIIKGAIIGGIVGGGIGAYLDAEDKKRMEHAAREAVTRNRPSYWSNPSSGMNGVITPVVGTSGPGCGTFQFENGRNGTILNSGNFIACKDVNGNVTF